jgi:hypothetical protein
MAYPAKLDSREAKLNEAKSSMAWGHNHLHQASVEAYVEQKLQPLLPWRTESAWVVSQ